MTSTKFKISGIGLDTETIQLLPPEEKMEFTYFHTSIAANNDFYLRGLLKENPNAKLVVSVGFTKDISEVLKYHLGFLDRISEDLLLLPAHADWSILGKRFLESHVIGVENPDSVEILEEIKSYLGEAPKAIYVPLCPLSFNIEVLEWARKEGCSILSYNPFGGYISSAAIIDAFTTSYLLGFSSYYSDIVFLSGRDLGKADEDRKYIVSKFMGSDSPGTKFVLRKSVNRLYKPHKKVVNTSFKFGENFIVPFNDPEVLYTDSLFGIGEVLSTIPEPKTDTEEEVYHILKEIVFPIGMSEGEEAAYSRYLIISYLLAKYPEEEGWNYTYVSFGGGMISLRLRKIQHKGWLRKKEEESYYFLLGYTTRTGNLFKEIIEEDFADEEV